MSYRYRYCGLVLDFEQPIDALDFCERNEAPEIFIRFTRLKPPADNSLTTGPNWAVGKDEAWWWLQDKVCFRVRSDRIDVDTVDTENSLVHALLLEAPMVMAMIFRGHFCLNAAAVYASGRTIIFSGASGSGRSSASARLALNGGEIIADSLARIENGEAGSQIIPQGSGTLLWPESIARLGIPNVLCRPERKESTIRRVKLASTMFPQAVDQIYWRNPHPLNHAISPAFEESDLTPFRRRFRRLALMTAGRLWIEPAGQSVKHFQWCLAVAKHCSLKPAPQHFFD